MTTISCIALSPANCASSITRTLVTCVVSTASRWSNVMKGTGHAEHLDVTKNNFLHGFMFDDQLLDVSAVISWNNRKASLRRVQFSERISREETVLFVQLHGISMRDGRCKNEIVAELLQKIKRCSANLK